MEYQEEEILKEREKKKRIRHQTLENGIYIKGELINFKKKMPLPGFQISLPENFKGMPSEIARIKYPSAFRPQAIITSPNLTVNMGFSIFPHQIEPGDIWILAERIKSVLVSESNGIRFYQTKKIKKTQGCWFDFRSHGMDSDIYNMMLFMPIQSSLLQATFNCSYKEGEEWNKIVLQMWESIEEAVEEEYENGKDRD